MALVVNNIFTHIDDHEQQAVDKALERLRIRREQTTSCTLAKTSLDARRRGKMRFVSSVVVRLETTTLEQQVAKGFDHAQVRFVEEKPFVFPLAKGTKGQIVIAGLGPAGLLAGLVLAEYGYAPLILERGRPMEERCRDVENFWRKGTLFPESNVQFGEGGAGAFSDGKLTTRIGDSRCRYVLETLVTHGAPEDILYKAKPHLGTDKLRDVVMSIRKRIQDKGGSILWQTRLTGLRSGTAGITVVETTAGDFPASALILAVGHSARDTFQMLADKGVVMTPKTFSVGLRIEHPQKVIDQALYGHLAGHPRLPVGEYQTSWRCNGRGVYTFCMCPGGLVVPSASELGGVVTNGMSYHARDGKNANAALVVEVTPEDFGGSVLDGVAFQRRLEQGAFRLGGGGYAAPGTTVGAFLGQSVKGEQVTPSYALGIREANLSGFFPNAVEQMLREGLVRFGKRIPGFSMTGAFLTGVESRTSSPVRILRGEDCQSVSLRGLYPCGEGAGAAGGIMSAAVDGLRCALAAAKQVNRVGS